jgi:hypothetical protein
VDASDGAILALLCRPLIAAGIALFVLLMRKREQLKAAQRLVVTVIAGAMVVVPAMFVMWFSDLNAATLVNQYIGMILIGVALLVLLWRRRQTGPVW